MEKYTPHRRSEERRPKPALGRSPLAKPTPRINLQHYGGRQPVLPCVEDSVRRPQRPGNQCAETPSGGTLPAIHPRELPGTAGSTVMLLQGTQNISLECQTLCACAPAAARENPHAAVQKLWMGAIPCGKHRKSRSEFCCGADTPVRCLVWITPDRKQQRISDINATTLPCADGTPPASSRNRALHAEMLLRTSTCTDSILPPRECHCSGRTELSLHSRLLAHQPDPSQTRRMPAWAQSPTTCSVVFGEVIGNAPSTAERITCRHWKVSWPLISSASRFTGTTSYPQAHRSRNRPRLKSFGSTRYGYHGQTAEDGEIINICAGSHPSPPQVMIGLGIAKARHLVVTDTTRQADVAAARLVDRAASASYAAKS